MPALERYGFTVRRVDSLREALSLLERVGEKDAEGIPAWQPDLIVVDSFADNDTGTRALRMLQWLGANPHCCRVPLLPLVHARDLKTLFEGYENRKSEVERWDRFVVAPFHPLEVVIFARKALDMPDLNHLKADGIYHLDREPQPRTPRLRPWKS